MTTAFQSGAFQNDSFQIDAVAPAISISSAQTLAPVSQTATVSNANSAYTPIGWGFVHRYEHDTRKAIKKAVRKARQRVEGGADKAAVKADLRRWIQAALPEAPEAEVVSFEQALLNVAKPVVANAPAKPVINILDRMRADQQFEDDEEEELIRILLMLEAA